MSSKLIRARDPRLLYSSKADLRFFSASACWQRQGNTSPNSGCPTGTLRPTHPRPLHIGHPEYPLLVWREPSPFPEVLNEFLLTGSLFSMSPRLSIVFSFGRPASESGFDVSPVTLVAVDGNGERLLYPRPRIRLLGILQLVGYQGRQQPNVLLVQLEYVGFERLLRFSSSSPMVLNRRKSAPVSTPPCARRHRSGSRPSASPHWHPPSWR